MRERTPKNPLCYVVRQTAFNCLTQTMCATQTKLRVFTKYLFSPKYFGESGIVDEQAGVHTSDLTVETNFQTARWYADMPGCDLSNAQNSKISENVTSNWGAKTSRLATGSLQYLATQYLDSSSIASVALDGAARARGNTVFSVREEDENEHEKRSESEEHDEDSVRAVDIAPNNEANGNNDSAEVVLTAGEEDVRSREFEVVELDAFNSNPSMEFFIFVVDKLENMNCSGEITSEEQWSVEPPTQSATPTSSVAAVELLLFRVAKGPMPTWMNILLSVVRNDKATDSSAPANFDAL